MPGSEAIYGFIDECKLQSTAELGKYLPKRLQVKGRASALVRTSVVFARAAGLPPHGA